MKTDWENRIEKLFTDKFGFDGKDGTYLYHLTRVKEAFSIGTMTLDDFVEVQSDDEWFIEFMKDVKELFLEQEEQHRAEIEKTEKAFGGCTKCYGKGYSTYREGYQSEPDFTGDKQNKPVMQTHYIPCTCDRGKQITNLLEQKGK